MAGDKLGIFSRALAFSDIEVNLGAKSLMPQVLLLARVPFFCSHHLVRASLL